MGSDSEAKTQNPKPKTRNCGNYRELNFVYLFMDCYEIHYNRKGK